MRVNNNEEGAILAISGSLTASTGYALDDLPDLDRLVDLGLPYGITGVRRCETSPGRG